MLSMLPRTNNFGMSLFDDMNSMFDTPFFRNAQTAPAMKTDIKEKDGLYLMTMDLPGFDKDNIKIQLKDGYLTVTAEQKEEKEENEEEKGGYIVRERNYGSCSRSFYVGDHVTENDVKAAYKDGALHLSFPKEAPKEVPETKYIAIE